MISLTGLAVWIVLLLVCAVCLKWASETVYQDEERVLAGVGLIAGLIALWMLVVAVLADTHGIPGYIFFLSVAAVGTWYIVRTFYWVMLITRTSQPEGS